MAENKKMKCPDCEIEMNYHAGKIDYSAESKRVDLELEACFKKCTVARLAARRR